MCHSVSHCQNDTGPSGQCTDRSINLLFYPHCHNPAICLCSTVSLVRSSRSAARRRSRSSTARSAEVRPSNTGPPCREKAWWSCWMRWAPRQVRQSQRASTPKQPSPSFLSEPSLCPEGFRKSLFSKSISVFGPLWIDLIHKGPNRNWMEHQGRQISINGGFIFEY